VNPARDEHDQHRSAPRDGTADDVAVVRGARNDRDPTVEVGELADSLLTAHADHLVAPIQRVLDHIPGRACRTATMQSLVAFDSAIRIQPTLAAALPLEIHSRV
jgi:hypothetical protein